jgi:hypothetical protein
LRGRSGFKNFLFLVWQHLNLPPPTEVQYDIADYLQHGPRRLIVEAFRGVGKSYITSAFVCWLLLLDPQLKILVVSASKSKATEFSFQVKRLIDEMEMLNHLRPDPSRNQRDSVETFDVGPASTSIAPSVKVVGITGQITGSRADIIIADDVETPKNSETEVQREKLRTLVQEFGAVRKVEEETRVVYLGTPQTEMSLYNHLASERGYAMRIWPVEVPQSPAKYGGRLAPFVTAMAAGGAPAGSPVDPKRFTPDVILDKKSEYGRSGYTLQFMLDTSLTDAEKYPLKLSDLIVFDCAPDKGPNDIVWAKGPQQALNELPNVGFNGDAYFGPMVVSTDAKDWAPYEGVVMAVDPAGRGGDETAYAVVAMLHSRLFLLDAGGLRGGYDETVLKALSVIAQRYKVNRIVVEPNFGDGMFNKLLAPVLNKVWPCTIEDTERSNAQKEKRIIDTLEPVMNQHRLVVDRQLIHRDFKSTEGRPDDQANRYRLFYQMTRLTKERGSLAKDDRIDAVALAVHYWTSIMGQDVERAAQEHRDRLLEADIERYFGGEGPLVLGPTTPQKTMYGRAL